MLVPARLFLREAARPSRPGADAENDAWDSHQASLDLALQDDLAAVDLAGLGKPIPAVELQRLLVLRHD